ncbi:C-type lectin domain family 10 member A-like isoform X3 [Sebastes umbrosus]|uniref:C-type lectin domain family 10 member A-like isoform X3 n=1 Tax=Sebastes umbrosus TaxID=72105 RepID=UPI00189C652B|nr:C-type lectin domain family 10 member A-like isoform X3 [Sebastes umbrosus]
MLNMRSLLTQDLQPIPQVRLFSQSVYHHLITFDCISLCSGRRSSERRFHGAVVLCLGLLSVFLLAGLIGLGVHYSRRDADLSTIKANLTERLQASENKLSSVSAERDLLNASLTENTKELDKLQSLSKENADLSNIKANLTERLQASENKLSSVSAERDLLNASLTENTKELDKLQSLSKEKKTCPAGWTMFSSACYLLSGGTGSWDRGREDCRNRGAHLVMIDSVKEQTFVAGLIKTHTWIGLNDKDVEGTWKWIDGTPLTLMNWALNEPNNGGGKSEWGKEDCAHIRPVTTQWNDLSCETVLSWICEKIA